MMTTFWMYTVLSSGMFALAAAQNDCPSEWLTAQFSIVSDRVLSASLGTNLLNDPTGSYFRDFLRFSESQIALEIETFREFFNVSFGLPFPELDMNGEARFENAILSYFRVPFSQTITVNTWITTGNVRNRCFNAFNGGVRVTFTGDQLLRGTYGGPTGINVTAGDDLIYGYYRIDARPQQPILIQYQSNTPGRLSPVDNYIVNDNRIFNSQLGFGTEIAVFRMSRFNEEGSLLRAQFYAVFAFPNVAPIFGLDN